MSESKATQPKPDGRADFDFFIGSWKLRNRCLREWLKGSTSWEVFEGTSVSRAILGGLGHIEEVRLKRASGVIEELAVRLFDPQTQQWRIYLADSSNGFEARPVIAARRDGRIEGYAYESFPGPVGAYVPMRGAAPRQGWKRFYVHDDYSPEHSWGMEIGV